MLKLWIVGASGQIGSAINEVLDPLEMEVFNTDKEELDITDTDEVLNFGVINRPDVIINCAGITDMDLCEKDKNYNSVLCGLITIKKDSAKAKLQRDIYETAILLPQEIGLEEDLDLLTKAAREMYELQFPGERLPE